MALFSLVAFLQLSRTERDNLARIAENSDRIAASLEALVTKLNEDDSPQAATVEITAGTPVEQPSPAAHQGA